MTEPDRPPVHGLLLAITLVLSPRAGGLHEGRLTYEPAPQDGARFVIELNAP